MWIPGYDLFTLLDALVIVAQKNWQFLEENAKPLVESDHLLIVDTGNVMLGNWYQVHDCTAQLGKFDALYRI